MSELFFIVLPVFILVLVYANYTPPHHTLLSTPEWSFVASILFGESLVRIAIANAKRRAYSPQRLFLLLVILLFGLVAAIVLLVLVLISEKPSPFLQAEQIVLFFIGAATFIYIAGLSHEIEEPEKAKQ
ncbi:MAG TPA: hypothetical protein VFR31_06565 [Thermoanaerobaculia bacterium]|nr:hypothetical protein [Thermoanaerobaculia bacterium]